MVRHTGAAPVLAVWKTAVLAVTPMTRKWWLRPVSRRTLLVFSEALISLSYTAKMVPPRGNAPRSIGYLPMALLLSYGGFERKRRSTGDLHPGHRGNGATVFRTVSSTKPDVLLDEMAPALGFAPRPSALTGRWTTVIPRWFLPPAGIAPA